jgi:hypothetical protein
MRQVVATIDGRPRQAGDRYPGAATGRRHQAARASRIIGRISQATRAVIGDRPYQRMLIESGFEPDTDSDPEKFRRFIEEDLARWAPVVKAIGLQLD